MKLTKLERQRVNVAMVVDNVIHREPLMIIDDVRVLYAPTMMKVLKSHGCMVTTITVLDRVFTIIAVDKSFLKWSETAKEVAVQHELGHLKNGDINLDGGYAPIRLSRLLCDLIFPKTELLADLNACENVGFNETCESLLEIGRSVGIRKFEKSMKKRVLVLKLYNLIHGGGTKTNKNTMSQEPNYMEV